MKLLNYKIKVNTSKKWIVSSVFLLGALSAGIISCSDDNSTEVSPDGVEVQSAYFQLYSNETPGGSVTYINVSENIPEKSDLSNSVELGIGVQAIAFDENIYSINPNASTITKWQVDKSTLELSVADVFSIASTGVAAPLRWGLNTINTTVIASETQAYTANFFDGIILEWNPTTMEIVKTHNIDPLVLPGDDYFIDIVNGKVLGSGKVMWTWIYFPPDGCCNMSWGDNLPIMGVLDPTTETFNYKYDDRMPYGTWVQEFGDGNMYATSNSMVGMIHNYFDTDEDSTYYLLKLDSDGDFDPSFEFVFDDIVDIGYGGWILSFKNNEIIVVYDQIDEWAESYDNRWNFWGVNKKIELINLTTGEVNDFTGFDEYAFAADPAGVVDGEQYFFGYNEGSTDILRQSSSSNIAVATEAEDGVHIFGFARLW